MVPFGYEGRRTKERNRPSSVCQDRTPLIFVADSGERVIHDVYDATRPFSEAAELSSYHFKAGHEVACVMRIFIGMPLNVIRGTEEIYPKL